MTQRRSPRLVQSSKITSTSNVQSNVIENIVTRLADEVADEDSILPSEIHDDDPYDATEDASDDETYIGSESGSSNEDEDENEDDERKLEKGNVDNETEVLITNAIMDMNKTVQGLFRKLGKMTSSNILDRIINENSNQITLFNAILCTLLDKDFEKTESEVLKPLFLQTKDISSVDLESLVPSKNRTAAFEAAIQNCSHWISLYKSTTQNYYEFLKNRYKTYVNINLAFSTSNFETTENNNSQTDSLPSSNPNVDDSTFGLLDGNESVCELRSNEETNTEILSEEMHVKHFSECKRSNLPSRFPVRNYIVSNKQYIDDVAYKNPEYGYLYFVLHLGDHNKIA
jgi:hypothetical protein